MSINNINDKENKENKINDKENKINNIENMKVDIEVNNRRITSVELTREEIDYLLAYINKLIDIHKGLKMESDNKCV